MCLICHKNSCLDGEKCGNDVFNSAQKAIPKQDPNDDTGFNSKSPMDREFKLCRLLDIGSNSSMHFDLHVEVKDNQIFIDAKPLPQVEIDRQNEEAAKFKKETEETHKSDMKLLMTIGAVLGALIIVSTIVIIVVIKM